MEYPFPPDFQQLVEEGRRAVQLGSYANWRLGDLAVEVTEHYGRVKGKRLRDYAALIDVPYSTLASYRRVSYAFEESSRHPELSWSHHVLVVEHPDADELLAKAAAEKWSVKQLAQAVRPNAESKSIERSIMTAEDRMNMAVDFLQQAVVDARRSSAPTDLRFGELERSLSDLAEEVSDLRLDKWWERLAPQRRADIETRKNKWLVTLDESDDPTPEERVLMEEKAR